MTLHGFVEGSRDDLKLMLAAERRKAHRIARDPYGEVGISLGRVHGVHKLPAAQHVYVQMVGSLRKIAVEDG